MIRLKLFFITLLPLFWQNSWSSESADFDVGLKAYNQRDFQLAFKEWSILANNGHAAAQTNLGVMYLTGNGVPQSFKKAIELFKSGSKSNLPFAQYNLALMYEKGQGGPFDNLRAYMWYSIASGNGSKISSARRDEVARFMTRSQIEKAQKHTERCIEVEYSEC